MKIIFIFVIVSFSVLLQGQQDKQEIVTSQTELIKLRKKFKNKEFVFQPKENNNTIFDRYVNGSKILIDSIDLILKSSNLESKRLLVKSMLDRPPSFIFDKEIQQVILNNLICDDTNLIWLIGRNKFNGFVEKFENKLSLYSYNCQADMLYWMGFDGTSKIGFTYLKQLLIPSRIDLYEHSHRLPNALFYYMKNGTQNIKDLASELALEIYSSKIIYNNLLKNDEFTAKYFKSQLLYHILTFGGKKSIPLAKSLYEQKEYEQDALTALVLNDHKKYKNELISRINKAYSNEYSKVGIDYIKASSDISIIPLIIKKYFKNKAHNCARLFLDNNLQSELEVSLPTIDDKLFVERVKEEIEIRTKTAYDVTLDLYNFGILKETDTLHYAQNIIEYQIENQLSINDKVEPYIYVISQSPISSNYFWESSDFPILYEEIFYNALKLSENDLGKAQIYCIATLIDDSSLAIHEIFVDFGEIGLSAVHVSTSISPDQKFIFDFLNLIPTKNNSKNKFHHDYFTDSTIVVYSDETVFKNFSNYLKSAYKD